MVSTRDHKVSSRPLGQALPRVGRELPREHRFTQDRLSAYLDHELDGHDRGRVRAHLASCVQCQRELDQLRLVVVALRRLRADGRSDPIIDALIMKLCDEAEGRSAGWSVLAARAGRRGHQLAAARRRTG